MPLSAHTPDIDDNRLLVVSSEERKTHKGINQSRRNIKRYAIDNDNIVSGERCDYLLLTESGHAYLIELKGNHVDKACSQVLATYFALENDLQGYTPHARIIPTRCTTHLINGTNYKKMLKHFGKSAIKVKNVLLEEDLL